MNGAGKTTILAFRRARRRQTLPTVSDPADRYFAVIPAAGVGSRLGAMQPKQYLALAGRPMLRWSVDALLAAPWIERVVVVVAPDDRRAGTLLAALPRVEVLAAGGATRRDSVLAGLRALAGSAAGARHWVLVHDAARPGLRPTDLERLRAGLAQSPVGGLLAVPVSDTVKRAGEDGRSVAATLERDRLWLAQTPQMFRLGPLIDALEAHPAVTDEAAAIERTGHAPWLIEGGRENFKVTTAEDLELMQRLLERR
ncbi:MAG: 2-C-methyl-D-erythritol 4-phosphate cytidylyltransferase [Burkholderiaceae bacterium]|jgi:2-C-methyl-D-erythritol 4-phosphate cytidylyltransferase|nr:2-C-methyl-D-erythritol 4-phosphate cytidylyltransferase [Burkholderiaceae bacterium]